MKYSESILLHIFFSFFILNSLFLRVSPKILFLRVYENGFNSTSYNISILKNEKKMRDDIWSKMVHIKSEQDMDDLINISRLFNRYWILYFDNEDSLNIIKNKEIPSKSKVEILGLITNLTEISEESTKDLKYSIAYVDQEHIENITSYDYKTEIRNTFIYFHYDRILSKTPRTYLLIITICLLVLSILIILIWIFLQKRTSSASIFFLQKVLAYLPYVNTALSFFMLLEVSWILNNDGSSDTKAMYVETAVVTFNAIFKTILWMLIIMVVRGWQILRPSLSAIGQGEVKNMIKIYIVLYLVICVDQILDSSGSKTVGVSKIIFYF